MDERNKKVLAYAVIGLCLVGAGVSYYMLSDSSPKQTPQLKATEARSQSIQTTIAEEQAKQPKPSDPPPPPPGVHRGSVAPPK